MTDKADVLINIKQFRCEALIRKICMKEVAASDVECCSCGQKTLKLVKGNTPNPWAQVVCTNAVDGVQCSFKRSCGHAEPPDPANKPKLT